MTQHAYNAFFGIRFEKLSEGKPFTSPEVLFLFYGKVLPYKRVGITEGQITVLFEMVGEFRVKTFPVNVLKSASGGNVRTG